jgi:patatin-like phospholipase/acyl hydrolase
MSKTFILACDGGGIRGYITATVLQALEGKQSFLSLAGLNAGTSTGSFISLALAAGVSIDTIQSQYQRDKAAPIFTVNPNIGSAKARSGLPQPTGVGGVWDDILTYLGELTNASYTNTGVANVAQSLLGSSTTLGQIGSIVVNTVQLDQNGVWAPLSITNAPGGAFADMLAWEAALCSGAAPIYFPPYAPTSLALGFCADGGLFANNPSMTAILTALASGVALSDIVLLSMDTGTTSDGMPAAVIDGWGGPLDMGPVQWLIPVAATNGATTTPKFPLLSTLMDTSSAAITASAQQLLGPRFLRVSVPLTAPVALDDTSEAAYATMDASIADFVASDAFTAAVDWIASNVVA